jgi:hypothetical protein
MYRHLLFIVCLLALLLSWPAAPSQAQPGATLTQEFSGGGVNNLLVYPAAYEAEAEIIRPASSDILSKLSALFSGDLAPLGFESQVRLLDETHPTFDAEARLVTPAEANALSGLSHSFSTDPVCDITVYRSGLALGEVLPFVMAHEITHCLVQYYIDDASGDVSGWWREGLAEWAAVMIYPDLAVEGLTVGTALREIGFLADNNHALTNSSNPSQFGGYGNVYWWLYLSTARSGGSPTAVLEMLADVPRGAPGEEAYQDFLADKLDAAGAMQEYVQLLAQNRIPFQPTYRGLFSPPEEVDLPGSVELSPADFTIDLNQYELVGDEDTAAVQVSSEGLDDLSNEVRVAINAGGVYTLLQDGAPLLICLEEGRVTLPVLISRGDGDGDAEVAINFDPISEDEESPCSEPLEPGDVLTLPAWRANDLANPEEPEERVLFLEIDENTIIEIWRGPDIVYTRSGGSGPFTGSLLQPGGYEFSATLQLNEDGTRLSTSSVSSGAFDSESRTEYTLTDEEYIVVTEVNRLLYDYSMFSTCMGLTGVQPGRAWVVPDLLIPLRVEPDAVYLGAKGLPEFGPNVYREELSDPSGEASSFTLGLTGDQIGYIHYEERLDGRRDCRIVYESMLVPYSGDLEGLRSRAGRYAE